MTLYEVNAAATLVQEAAHEDANIIFGSVIDDTMGDKVRVTVIATGFNRVVKEIYKDSVAHAERRSEVAVPLNLAIPEATSEAPPAFGQMRPKRGIPLFEDESFDVPAFLRKGTD